ncbi:MAG: c-type cytochrome [Cyclobacteriaceae bacterium]
MKLKTYIVTVFAAIIIAACGNHNPKLAQYMVHGERLYQQHCSNCHQPDGKGFGLLYPPLANADYLKKKKDSIICIIRNGMSGPVTVNGQIYDQAMPGNEKLTDLEIAEILTYIYVTWEGENEATDVNMVRAGASRCGF